MLGAAQLVFADDSSSAPPPSQGESKSAEDLAPDIGVRHLHAFLGVAETYTNNFYYEHQNANSVYGTLVKPELAYQADTGRFQANLGVDATYGAFSTQGTLDDYLDWGGRGVFAWTPTTRVHFDANGAYEHSHDPFGTDRTENAAVHDQDLDVWNQVSGGIHYRYGAPTAILNAVVGISALSKEYETNHSATQFLNYEATTYDYALFWNYSPKTAAVVDFSRTQVLFDVPFPTVPPTSNPGNGHEYRMHGGWRWLATGKTSGDVRVGYLRRTFDDGSPDLNAFDWLIGANWSPTTLSLISLHTGRTTGQTYRSDTHVINTRNGSLVYTQTWTVRIKTRLDAGRTDETFLGAGRVDRVYNTGLELDYLIGSALSVFVKGSYVDRSSSDPTLEYKRGEGFIGVRLGR